MSSKSERLENGLLGPVFDALAIRFASGFVILFENSLVTTGDDIHELAFKLDRKTGDSVTNADKSMVYEASLAFAAKGAVVYCNAW